MIVTVDVIFDGQVLRPCKPVRLKKDERYKVQIEVGDDREAKNVWEVLDAMAGSIEGPEDWSTELDHYLYGTPKQGS